MTCEAVMVITDEAETMLHSLSTRKQKGRWVTDREETKMEQQETTTRKQQQETAEGVEAKVVSALNG